MTDKLFDNQEDYLNDDQKFFPGYYSPYQQQQFNKFNKQNLPKSPLNFMSPLNYEENDQFQSCFENNPLNRMFEYQLNSYNQEGRKWFILFQIEKPRQGEKLQQKIEFQTPQPKICQENYRDQKKFMSDGIRIKNQTPSREEFCDPDVPARSEKGLRNLSVKVKQIVCELKCPTYKEVAERLIFILWEQNRFCQIRQKTKDEQNIKRRVYDALNVMIASGVLKRQGKQVLAEEELVYRFNNHQQTYRNEYGEEANKLVNYHKNNYIQKRLKVRLRLKKERLNELMSKYLAINNLIIRNQTYLTNQDQLQEQLNFPLISFAINPIEINFHLEKKVLIISSKKILDLSSDIDVLIQLQFHQQNPSNYFLQFPTELRKIASGDLQEWVERMNEQIDQFYI